LTAPVGQHGLLKASWNRRDSAYIDNTCTKWGVGYQHNLDRRAYLYADYARINNGAGGTCTIAISDEATSADLGQGDLGGYGTQGLDFGVVFKF
jgi:outer membrane protease